MSTVARPISRLTVLERLNFLLTNRIPRRWLTLAMGRFSKLKSPVLTRLSLKLWQLFVDDLRLEEAKKSQFDSVHDCFTRELKTGARSIDHRSYIVVSPCDAVVGEYGDVNNLEALQAKGFPYSVSDLLVDAKRANRYRHGNYVTLRLKSSMYHRFHAPCDARVETVEYISGDTWNVNPIALKVVEQLFCKNERAVIDLMVDEGSLCMVPVAAILVASMRIHGLPDALNLEYKGPNSMLLQRSFEKGEEIGYFEHGSTIILFATGEYRLDEGIKKGHTIRMGQPLLTTRSA